MERMMGFAVRLPGAMLLAGHAAFALINLFAPEVAEKGLAPWMSGVAFMSLLAGFAAITPRYQMVSIAALAVAWLALAGMWEWQLFTRPATAIKVATCVWGVSSLVGLLFAQPSRETQSGYSAMPRNQ